MGWCKAARGNVKYGGALLDRVGQGAGPGQMWLELWQRRKGFGTRGEVVGDAGLVAGLARHRPSPGIAAGLPEQRQEA